MSLLDDARQLRALDGSDGTGVCAVCETPPDMTFFDGPASLLHTSDCPWNSMPRIVAALEAAEHVLGRLSNPDWHLGCSGCGSGGDDLTINPSAHDDDCPLWALVDALKGEVPVKP